MRGLRPGINNMLRQCGGLKPGERVLILSEGEDASHYDPGLAPEVAAAARAMGLDVDLVEMPFSPLATPPPPAVMQAIARADTAVFLARRGDQLRFDPVLAQTRPVICYALDRAMMASSFGRADHRGMVQLLALVNAALEQARHIRVTCPLGTDFEGPGARFAGPSGEVTVRRFPLSVFTPVPAGEYAGTIAVAGFLTGTGRTYYQPYDLPLSDVLNIRFQGNRILGFSGADACAAAAHYGRLGAALREDCSFVHSWHAGLHPGCSYDREAGANIARWGGGAFGNPRVLHFHTCGTAPPGEISLNVIDPTIRADGLALWEDGWLHPERLEGGPALLAAYPSLAEAFAHPSRAAGLAASGRLSSAFAPAQAV